MFRYLPCLFCRILSDICFVDAEISVDAHREQLQQDELADLDVTNIVHQRRNQRFKGLSDKTQSNNYDTQNRKKKTQPFFLYVSPTKKLFSTFPENDLLAKFTPVKDVSRLTRKRFEEVCFFPSFVPPFFCLRTKNNICVPRSLLCVFFSLQGGLYHFWGVWVEMLCSNRKKSLDHQWRIIHQNSKQSCCVVRHPFTSLLQDLSSHGPKNTKHKDEKETLGTGTDSFFCPEKLLPTNENLKLQFFIFEKKIKKLKDFSKQSSVLPVKKNMVWNKKHKKPLLFTWYLSFWVYFFSQYRGFTILWVGMRRCCKHRKV